MEPALGAGGRLALALLSGLLSAAAFSGGRGFTGGVSGGSEATVCVDGSLGGGTNLLTWLAVGDWGDPNNAQRSVVAQMGKEAERLGGVHFALLVGDNFYPRGVSTWDDPLFDTTYEQVFVSEALQVPHFVVLGNHDYRKNPEAQVQRSHLSASRWVMPSRWYSREFVLNCGGDGTGGGTPGPSLLFLFLDTMVLAGGTAGQVSGIMREMHWAWIEDQLHSATADWIIVVGHHPVYSAGYHGDTATLVQGLMPLLEWYGVDMYISGHDHNEQFLLLPSSGPTGVDGARFDPTLGPAYVLTGSGSKLRQSPTVSAHPGLVFMSTTYGFTSMRLNQTHLKTNWVTMTGEVVQSHVRRPRSKANRGKAASPAWPSGPPPPSTWAFDVQVVANTVGAVILVGTVAWTAHLIFRGRPWEIVEGPASKAYLLESEATVSELTSSIRGGARSDGG